MHHTLPVEVSPVVDLFFVPGDAAGAAVDDEDGVATLVAVVGAVVGAVVCALWVWVPNWAYAPIGAAKVKDTAAR